MSDDTRNMAGREVEEVKGLDGVLAEVKMAKGGIEESQVSDMRKRLGEDVYREYLEEEKKRRYAELVVRDAVDLAAESGDLIVNQKRLAAIVSLKYGVDLRTVEVIVEKEMRRAYGVKPLSIDRLPIRNESVVPGWIRHGVCRAGGFTAIVGRSGSGKSMEGILAVLSTATGRVLYKDGEFPASWSNTGKPQVRGTAVILCGEMESVEIKLRLQAVANEFGIDLSDQEIAGRILATDYTAESQLIDLGRPEDLLEDLHRVVDGIEDLKLLVIDTVRAFHSGTTDQMGENGAAYWRFMGPLSQFRAETGCAVILLHHASKSGGYSGHNNFERMLDTIIHLDTPARGEDGIIRQRRTILKDRQGLFGGEGSYMVDVVADTTEEDPKYSVSLPRKVKRGHREAPSYVIREAILEQLEDGSMKSLKAIREALGVDSKTWKKRHAGIMSQLVDEGAVVEREVKHGQSTRLFYSLPGAV